MKKIFSALLALVSSVALATTTVPVQLLNPTGSSSGQTIVSTGSSSAPGWATVPLSGLSAIAANTVLANATASSAAPAAFAMPSCTPNTGALGWTTSTGFICNATLNATTLLGFNWAVPGAIGSTTPSTGAFTTISATSTITPSQTAGIVGTTTNNNANAGSVGELLTNQTASTSLTSGTSANATSVSLTAGDWDVVGTVTFSPAGSTVVTYVVGGISTTSATLPGGNGGASFQIPGSSTAGITVINSTGPVRISVASTTTVYLVANSIFATSTMTASGFIRARRVR